MSAGLKKLKVRNGAIVGWQHVATNSKGEVLARSASGFILRWPRRDARGNQMWPGNQAIVSAAYAREWLAELRELAFPKETRARAAKRIQAASADSTRSARRQRVRSSSLN